MNNIQRNRINRIKASSEMDLMYADMLALNPFLKKVARELRRSAKKRRRKIRRFEDKVIVSDYGY